MLRDGCRRGIGIRRNYDLILRPYADKTESHFHGCGCRVEADSLRGMTVTAYPALELLGLRSGGNPSGKYGLAGHRGLSFTHVRRRERNLFNTHKYLIIV